MSLTSSRLGPPTIPLSSSDNDTEEESLGYIKETVYSPTMNFQKHPSLSAPLQDFKESLENEKNIRKLFSKLDSMNVRTTLNGGSDIMSVIEKNYKLQIQTLLEEVNQLKLDKKLLERKTEKAKKDTSKIFDKVRFEGGNSESSEEIPVLKRMLESKNSTIRELEFQVSQLKIENNNMKTRMEIQKQQIDQFFERLADAESFKSMIEEKDEELDQLRGTLYTVEAKMEKVLQELSHLRNENISLKLKGACTPTNQGGMNTGGASFWNPPLNTSKDVSFFSLVEKFNGGGQHQRNGSDINNRSPGRILNFSELNDLGSVSPTHLQQNSVPLLRSKTLMLASMQRVQDSPEPPQSASVVREQTDRPRKQSDFNQLQKLSVKMLSDYEQGIKQSGKSEKKKSSKTLDRIIEVNKIKNYYIEEQNKKLLSILSVAKGERTEGLTKR